MAEGRNPCQREIHLASQHQIVFNQKETSISRDMGSAAEGQDSRAPNKSLFPQYKKISNNPSRQYKEGQNSWAPHKSWFPQYRKIFKQAIIGGVWKCVKMAKNGNDLGDLDFDYVTLGSMRHVSLVHTYIWPKYDENRASLRLSNSNFKVWPWTSIIWPWGQKFKIPPH